jgi:predicted outer membrane protein
MGIQKKLKVSRYFLVAALVAIAVSGCSATRQQPAPDANAAVASPAAQATQASEAKRRVTHVPSPEVTSKNTSAAILEQIHQANLKEIAVGKLAEEKASSDEVRAYADQLVKDHTAADQMVFATAQKKGARLRDSAARRENARGKVTEQKLSSASGTQFDRRFLEQTSADHKKLISELQQEREDATDDDVEALIDKIVPILQQHHDLAQILMKKEPA